MPPPESIITPEARILITGSSGFVGTRVVANLLARGFYRLRCLTRASSDLTRLTRIIAASPGADQVEVVQGNLLSRPDCERITRDVAVVYHLAAGTGEKSFPDAFMGSVVTTRNLLEACVQHGGIRRFVSASSFTVYSNRNNPGGRILDESSPLEDQLQARGEAYCFAKLKQDELVQSYRAKHGLPSVLVRPGVVYGPGKPGITGRVGRATFGLFMHLGGGNRVPLTYVENCADAIVLAGLVPGVEGETFNIVDDDLPSSRRFLRLYKRHVKPFRSISIPRPLSYLLCCLWGKYSTWSRGQLPPLFNRHVWHVYWKGSRYPNDKLKQRLGWRQPVPTAEGLTRFFASCRQPESHA
jgi:nucleoside-diphosphate-sugar epimerase